MSSGVDLDVAIARAIDDGDCVHFGGFTHLIPFAAAHEIIRQGIVDLTISRLTPDLVFDQLLAAGCADSVIFSYAGNPGVGSLNAFRRACEGDIPHKIQLEEYSHYALIARLSAGAQDLPFIPIRTLVGSDLVEENEHIETLENPFEGGDEETVVVPPLRPDVAIVRAQRADEDGNAHIWGIHGDVVEAAFAAETVILSVEEIVDRTVIRSDPNRTAISQSVVDYVVECPFGSHPSYAQGYYGRDNRLYRDWPSITESHASTIAWLDEWVTGVKDHEHYVEQLGDARIEALRPEPAFAEPVDMGRYD